MKKAGTGLRKSSTGLSTKCLTLTAFYGQVKRYPESKILVTNNRHCTPVSQGGLLSRELRVKIAIRIMQQLKKNQANRE